MVEMPQVVVAIVCLTKILGPIDAQTGWQDRDWDLTGGKYHCRRLELQVTSMAETHDQQPPPWGPDACLRAAITVGTQWDASNPSSPYRLRWVACPTPIHESKDPSSAIVGWKIPECPYKDNTVECEMDSVI